MQQVTPNDEDGEEPFVISEWTKPSARKAELAELERRKKPSASAYEKPSRIRLSEPAHLPAMSQTRVQVTTALSGLIVIEPKQMARTYLRVASGIAEVQANRPVWILVRSFHRVDQRLPKNMVMATASKSPIRITEVDPDMGREFAK